MIHLRIRSEYSFRRAYGKLADIFAVLKTQGATAAALTDRGTWGHVAFSKAAKAAGVRPIYGAEFTVVADARKREKQPGASVALLARNAAGLREIYRLVTLSNTEGFYYFPRLDWRDINGASGDVYALLGPGTLLDRLAPRSTFYLEYNPTNPAWNRRVAADRSYGHVICADNHFPRPDDREAYEILAQRDKIQRTTAMHLADEDELRLAIPEAEEDAYLNTERIAADCDVKMPRAENIHIDSAKDLRALCMEGARQRGLAHESIGFMKDREYQERLDRELEMIASKKFEDYFFLVGDMVRWAKTKMLVGPARGSSAGSLVCYLLGITDIDPLFHDTMFERFIDVTRADLPDVDIDFQDDRRDLVIQYLKDTYGEERVGRIGTVARLKAKSCLGDVARELQIPQWEIRDVQDAVIERSTGDARAQFCVQDALESLEVGRALVAKYPGIMIASKLEAHAQHSGKHAAGVIVAQDPVVNYCSLDKEGVAQIDKKDAEALNMLKIDALGLRVLSVIQDCLDQIGKTREWLVNYRLDDEDAFEILNSERYAGIFQYEGYALQSLCRQMKIKSFDDVAVIGALARPGPLHCGAANDYILRRTGQTPVTYQHPALEPLTKDTYGVIIYQEQVMTIARAIGRLDWEDVNQLRRAMSKSLGDEFFNTYWERFKKGAAEQGIPEGEARGIWERMCTFGSWAFNKSHGISYGMISYWCCVLKAHWPLEFAAACLRNEKDIDQGVRVLRDLAREGFKYKPVDPERSGLQWSVVEGVLVGGLTNIKGIGTKKAQEILARRMDGRKQLPGTQKLLDSAKTPYDDIFEGDRRFGDIYRNPRAHHVTSGTVSHICDINDAGDYVFIAKMMEKNLRDMNEYQSVVKRGGRIIKRNPLFLNLKLEDDTGSISARISRYDYKKWGKPLIEKGRIGEWYMWKGTLRDDGWRVVEIKRWRTLEESSPLFKAAPVPRTPGDPSPTPEERDAPAA